MFLPSATSVSTIVTSVSARSRMTSPSSDVSRRTVNTSSSSGIESSTIGIVMALSRAPGRKVRVPLTGDRQRKSSYNMSNLETTFTRIAIQ